VLEIREKHAFTDDPVGRREPCSNGVYAWRTGGLFAASLDAVDAPDERRIAGEHYPSQCFQPLVEQGRDVVVYDTSHYLQWGNPRDLREYEHHAAGFARRIAPWPRPPRGPGALVVPMAGLGQRFADAGYAVPKPLVEVGGRPMAVAAVADLPRREREVFVLRADLPGLDDVRAALDAAFPGSTTVVLDGPTDGQARTVALGVARAEVDADAPLVIGACDNGLRYDAVAHDARLAGADVLVWAMRGHPGARVHPRMYGWIDADGDRVRRLSVKVPLSDPATDPAIVGAFSFRRAGDFLRAFERQVARGGQVRGEYYVDTLLEDALALGLDVRLFEVDAYYGWGTPDDLRTFAYWQGFFDRWPHHPYRLDDDPGVDAAAIDALRAAASPPEALPALPRPGRVR
jgi:CTP:molybdopterin cytidylyltransferase MocA